MAMVEDVTAATTAVDTTADAGAITDGAAEVGAIRVTAGVGDSGWDSAGGGHTGIRTTTVTALGDTPILTTIHIVLLATIALITGTTILPRRIPDHNPGTTRRLLRDHPRRQGHRTTRPVKVRMIGQGVASFPLTG